MADLTSMLQAAAGAGGGGGEPDPFFNQTTLLLHGDGTNGAQNNTFLDSSTNNFTITRNGNTTQGTFSPFSNAEGEWSNYFDGSGDYLTTPATGQFAPTGDFTVGHWVYITSLAAAYQMTLSNYEGNNATDWAIEILSNGTLYIYTNGATIRIQSSSGAIVANQWHYISFSRSGSTITGYLDGASLGTYTQSGTFGTATKTIAIGARKNNTEPVTGYISNVILIDGSAVTTVPTSPATAVSGTSLLTCQSNRFVDNSTNNFAITVNGNTSVQPFSPFLPSAAYDPSVNGGSGYFDGSGDGVTTISSAMSYAGDYCIECFFYTNTTTTYACLYSDEASGTGATILLNNGSNNGQITTFGFGASNFASTTTGLNNNAWHHVAITLSGTTLRLFIDGVLENTLLSVPVPGTTTSTVRVGTSFFSGRDFGGYISNFRIVVGSPVYTSTFTPPTAPLTAITNTSLLLLAQNAGIFDNTGKNNLETVADAQIDTSVRSTVLGLWSLMGLGIICLPDIHQSGCLVLEILQLSFG
jgi:hypothetical protein